MSLQVHIGSMVASLYSRLEVGPLKGLIELRLPKQQRTWIGIGAATGVAAAFNAPLGGVLYAFEEVCSHWTHAMTWRALFSTTIGALTFTSIMSAYGGKDSDGFLISTSFVIGIDKGDQRTYAYEDFGWMIFLGAMGGILGGLYTAIVLRCNALRGLYLNRRWKKALEAVVASIVAFAILFHVPYAFDCEPCPANSNCDPDASGSGSGRRLEPRELESWAGSTSLHLHGRALGAGGGLVYLQHDCPEGEYNELASLLLSTQEGLLKLLLERDTGASANVSPRAVGYVLLVYFVIAVAVFGIAVPAGNFVPAMTLGAALGRLFGTGLAGAGLIHADDSARYALLGAGAVLCGVTRMTITLVAIPA